MLIEIKAAPEVVAWKQTLRNHWPEYLIEGSCLGLFMVSACVFGTLLGHSASPVVRQLEDPTLRRILMGVAMGITAVGLIYSRPGKRSGAHMNPATTVTFLRLKKIQPVDALFYGLSQFLGGALGVMIAGALLGRWLADPSVKYVVTQPGLYGASWAFAAELLITFLLMSAVLRISNTPGLNRYTGIFVGLLVMLYIAVEAPISGMSMNPARTLASAWSAGIWTSIWIYFVAPPLGMLLAAELFVRRKGWRRVLCAKLHHENSERCIFRCNYPG